MQEFSKNSLNLVIYAAINGFNDRMTLYKFSQYEWAIPKNVKQELLKSF